MVSSLTEKQRIALFFVACVPARLLLVYIAKNINVKYLPIMGYIAILGGIGFAYQYMRKAGGAFGQKSWWNYMRPVHSVFYIAFGMLAVLKNKQAYGVLLIDLLVGTLVFLKKYYTKMF